MFVHISKAFLHCIVVKKGFKELSYLYLVLVSISVNAIPQTLI